MAALYVELAARFGVPTFVLVLAIFMLTPRLDRMIAVTERLDAELQIIVANCGYSTQRQITIPPELPGT